MLAVQANTWFAIHSNRLGRIDPRREGLTQTERREWQNHRGNNNEQKDVRVYILRKDVGLRCVLGGLARPSGENVKGHPRLPTPATEVRKGRNIPPDPSLIFLSSLPPPSLGGGDK